MSSQWLTVCSYSWNLWRDFGGRALEKDLRLSSAPSSRKEKRTEVGPDNKYLRESTLTPENQPKTRPDRDQPGPDGEVGRSEREQLPESRPQPSPGVPSERFVRIYICIQAVCVCIHMYTGVCESSQIAEAGAGQLQFPQPCLKTRFMPLNRSPLRHPLSPGSYPLAPLTCSNLAYPPTLT